jgi:hypothetical protein
MRYLDTENALAVAVVAAIRAGDLNRLGHLPAEHPELATVRLGDEGGMSRTLMHVATDWPGHDPNGPQVSKMLVQAGAEADGRFAGPDTEMALMWAGR